MENTGPHVRRWSTGVGGAGGRGWGTRRPRPSRARPHLWTSAARVPVSAGVPVSVHVGARASVGGRSLVGRCRRRQTQLTAADAPVGRGGGNDAAVVRDAEAASLARVPTAAAFVMCEVPARADTVGLGGGKRGTGVREVAADVTSLWMPTRLVDDTAEQRNRVNNRVFTPRSTANAHRNCPSHRARQARPCSRQLPRPTTVAQSRPPLLLPLVGDVTPT